MVNIGALNVECLWWVYVHCHESRGGEDEINDQVDRLFRVKLFINGCLR